MELKKAQIVGRGRDIVVLCSALQEGLVKLSCLKLIQLKQALIFSSSSMCFVLDY